MTDSRIWKKPITPEKEKEIKAYIESHSKAQPMMCWNTDDQIKLTFCAHSDGVAAS